MLSARQQHCLQGIGITAWKTRSPGLKKPQQRVSPSANSIQQEMPATPVPPVIPDVTPTPPPTPTTTTTTATAIEKPQQNFDLSGWPQTLQAIEQCQNCPLATGCTQKVPGKGFQQADVLIIGEAPGHDEDMQGLPFVGRAGQLLDKMLLAIDIDPEKVYITNILKCRPPNNRDPQAQEVEACSAFLQAQIKLVQPKVIFAVGRISAQNLLHKPIPLGKLRNEVHTLPDSDIPLIVTYHPAYLLRSPAEKAKSWQDLKLLKSYL